MKFETYEAEDGWRWRLTGANGEVFGAAHEGFSSKFEAERNASLELMGLLRTLPQKIVRSRVAQWLEDG